MLAMARALITDPVLLLLDEPSAGVQPDFVDAIFAKVREFSRNGLSVLIVEQKARQSLAFSDYAYVLEMGRNRFEGTGQELLANPAVIDLYLGAGRHVGCAERNLAQCRHLPLKAACPGQGGGVERGEPLTFIFDGEPIVAFRG